MSFHILCEKYQVLIKSYLKVGSCVCYHMKYVVYIYMRAIDHGYVHQLLYFCTYRIVWPVRLVLTLLDWNLASNSTKASSKESDTQLDKSFKKLDTRSLSIKFCKHSINKDDQNFRRKKQQLLCYKSLYI